MVALSGKFGVEAYMGRCATTQGIQGKGNFEFMSYGSRVIGANIKWPHGGAIWKICDRGSLLASKKSVCTVSKRSDQWYQRLAVHRQTETQTVDPANFGSQS